LVVRCLVCACPDAVGFVSARGLGEYAGVDTRVYRHAAADIPFGSVNAPDAVAGCLDVAVVVVGSGVGCGAAVFGRAVPKILCINTAPSQGARCAASGSLRTPASCCCHGGAVGDLC
jgi:hypothetical protein